MKDLSQQRCFNHEFREAVACCPECHRYFCRECITEHDDRVLCTACLGKMSMPSSAGTLHFSKIIGIVQFVSGGLFVWLFFYYLGQILLSLPTSFHEGTLWQDGLWGGR